MKLIINFENFRQIRENFSVVSFTYDVKFTITMQFDYKEFSIC